MKSIKEKAEENCIKYGNLGNVAYQEFVAGANYVLGEILDKTSKCITVEDAYETFLECIEQLKK